VVSANVIVPLKLRGDRVSRRCGRELKTGLPQQKTDYRLWNQHLVPEVTHVIDFTGQVVIVTGAGRGLGRLYAMEIARFTTVNATSHKETQPDLTVHGESFVYATWETPNGVQIAASVPAYYASPGATPVHLSNVIRFGEAKPAGSG